MVPDVTMADFEEEWPKHVGDPTQSPEGDEFRKRIINPALFHVVSEYLQGNVRGRAPKGMTPVPVGNGQLSTNGADGKKVKILDLGCGEGYLGRLFERKGYLRQYIGVDRSAKLLASLRTRAGTSGLHTAVERSLDALTLVADEKDVDFVFLVLVLEHLQKPFDLLKQLATLPPETICVAVTLNPHYRYEQPSTSDSTDTTVNVVLEEGSCERSAQLPWKNTDGKPATHTLTVHSHYVYEQWLRDADLVVHRAQALLDPERPWMPPPFILWVFSAMGSPLEETATAMFGKTPLEHSSLSGTKLIKVPPGFPILTRHMLGGRLFVVQEGTAMAYITSTATEFLSGTLFGDIEAGWGDEPDEVYHFPVWAGIGGCTLAVIPSASLPSLTSTREVRDRMFALLRSRLIERWWLHPADRIQGKKAAKTPPAGDMARLARALYFSLLRAPASVGLPVVYVPTLKNARSSGEWDGYRDLYHLVKYGFILASETPSTSNHQYIILDPLGLRSLALARDFKEATELLDARKCPRIAAITSVTCKSVYDQRKNSTHASINEERDWFKESTTASMAESFRFPPRS